MRKYLSIILSIFVLTFVIVGTGFWIQSFHESVRNYPSPLSSVNLPPASLDLTDKGKVVFVIVSGLGENTAQLLPLPALTQISQTGVRAVIQSNPPSYPQTSLATLVTGASAETNGASPVPLPLNALSLLDIDTIFAQARNSRHKTALLGPEVWRHLIPRNHLDETFFLNTPGPETDQIIFENALLLLNEANTDLLMIHFTQLDVAVKNQGGVAGTAVLQAAGQIDEYLKQIHQSIDYSDTVLVILGDYGHTETGGYGGAEPEITRQPLVMVGNAIIPGVYSDIQQTDITPTISTLLGTAPPAVSQGRILFEMLRLNEQNQTLAQLALSNQRVSLSNAYVSKLTQGDTTLPDTVFADLAQAQTSFNQNNVSGAFQLALLAQQTADTQMAVARGNLIQAEQFPRLIVSAILLLTWVIVMWRRRGTYFSLILIATTLTVVLYHVLYQLQGFEYSISSFNNFSDWPFLIARRIAVSLLAGGGLILILLMLANEENWVTLLGTAYGFSVLVTFIFSLPLFWAFWQNGWSVALYLPDVNAVFWQISASFEAIFAAILGLFLPWPIMLLILAVNLIRRGLNKTESQPEPDALPGLHL